MAPLILHQSRCESLAMVCLHGLAVLAVALSALPWPARAAVWLLIGVSAFRAWRDGAGTARPRALAIAADHSRLQFSDGEIRARLPQAVFVSEWLLVVRLDVSGRRRPMWLMLWPGSLSARDDWRLRCYLRGYPLPPG